MSQSADFCQSSASLGSPGLTGVYWCHCWRRASLTGLLMLSFWRENSYYKLMWWMGCCILAAEAGVPALVRSWWCLSGVKSSRLKLVVWGVIEFQSIPCGLLQSLAQGEYVNEPGRTKAGWGTGGRVIWMENSFAYVRGSQSVFHRCLMAQRPE